MNAMNGVAKSIIGALVAGVGALQVASADGVVTSGEWIQVGSVALAALVLVWGVPNVAVKAPSDPPKAV